MSETKPESTAARDLLAFILEQFSSHEVPGYHINDDGKWVEAVTIATGPAYLALALWSHTGRVIVRLGYCTARVGIGAMEVGAKLIGDTQRPPDKGPRLT